MKRIIFYIFFIINIYTLNSNTSPLVKNFEKMFQISFGFNITTTNMLSFIDNIKMALGT